MNELEGWNKDGTKRHKRSEYMSWHKALKSFTILLDQLHLHYMKGNPDVLIPHYVQG